ncbi:hypothetical protein M0R72_13770 [Candidatus Pacearchaeota archaeon]|jgi:hypothetical protein|nr:hypothetical protein [Candidatus Pacearchaeota archaeon]
MTTPTADELIVYFASKYLSSAGDAITEQTADAGGTVKTIVDAALTQAADYWNGATGWFEGDTTTAALRNQPFHVRDFDADTDTLTLSKSLPAAPVAGDTYRLVLGGYKRSGTRLFGLQADGAHPEIQAVTGTNITGMTLKYLNAGLGEGTLSIFFDQSEETLHIKEVGGSDYGNGLDVSGDVTDGVLYTADGNAFAIVDVTNGSLPGSDKTDTFTTSAPTGFLTPDAEGYETADATGGSSRYVLEIAKNNDGADSMIDLTVISGVPAGTATTIAAGESLTTAAGSFTATSLADWIAGGFWVKNTTKDDCRYVTRRDGNKLYCAAVLWGTLAFDAGAEEIAVGDLIVGATSGAEAYVDQIVVSSGSWVSDDAAGTIIFRGWNGTAFDNDENIEVSSTVMAVADGASALGHRGYTAVAWEAADDIEPMADVDLGLDAPSTDAYENPATNVAPSGVTFGDYPTFAAGLAIGDMAAAAYYGVWKRLTILDGMRIRADVDMDTYYRWS